MRHAILLALLLTGCTVQLGTSGLPTPKGSPKAQGLAFKGVWKLATGATVKGPVHQDPCAKFRRYVFGPGTGGALASVKVTDANAGFTGFAFDYEELSLVIWSDENHYTLSGNQYLPGPTDGPVAHPVSYDLHYDPDRHLLTGKATYDKKTVKDVVLVETDAAETCESPSPSPSPSPTPMASPLGYVVQLAYQGGLCVNGPCGSTEIFRADGSFTRQDGDVSQTGHVDPALVQAVADQIAEADFTAIKAKPFKGTCPTAYDGSEVTYTFATAHGEEVLASCTYALDDQAPLFTATAKLKAAADAP